MAGIAAIISCPLALASLFAAFGAFNWDFDTAFNPAKAIAYTPDPSRIVRLGWMLDIPGFYLLWAPAIFWLHHRFSEKAPLQSRTFTFFGLGYILCGALGAAMLAGTVVPLHAAYGGSDAATQAIVSQVYIQLNHEVFDGIWNLYAMLMAAVWLLGMGRLMRPERRRLGWGAQFIGAACLLDVVGMALQSETLSVLGLNLYLWLSPLWMLWLGVAMLREKE